MHTNDILARILEVQVHPNPTNGKINIDIQLDENAKLKARLYNQAGIMIMDLFEETFESGEHQRQYDVSELRSGQYFLNIELDGERMVRKVSIIN